ncbi:MAG: hypothetical protein WKH64_08360 [Chloroflexia bacterium]
MLIPRVALDNDGRRLLDGLTLDDLRERSPSPLEPAAELGEVVDLILRLTQASPLATPIPTHGSAGSSIPPSPAPILSARYSPTRNIGWVPSDVRRLLHPP